MQPKAEEFTQSSWSSIIDAQNNAKIYKHQYIETEHLLLALIEKNDLANRIIIKKKGSVNNIKKYLIEFLKSQPCMKLQPQELFIGDINDLSMISVASRQIRSMIKQS